MSMTLKFCWKRNICGACAMALAIGAGLQLDSTVRVNALARRTPPLAGFAAFLRPAAIPSPAENPTTVAKAELSLSLARPIVRGGGPI